MILFRYGEGRGRDKERLDGWVGVDGIGFGD